MLYSTGKLWYIGTFWSSSCIYIKLHTNRTMAITYNTYSHLYKTSAVLAQVARMLTNPSHDSGYPAGINITVQINTV